MSKEQASEGFVDFRGYHTWYASYGDLQANSPLLVLHGGPGLPHDYLLDLAALSEEGQPVVFYDQLGCGNSDQPDDPELWSIDLFIDEINTVRDALGLDSIKLFGHSWGGSLALEYCLTKPEGVEKLVLHSPLLDTELWVEEVEKLKDMLPSDVAEAMRRHEQAGTTESEEYKAAYKVFKDNFVCRLDPRPPRLQRSVDRYGTKPYEAMWGPSEAYATGTLKGWSIIDRFVDIEVPTLIISGRHDEATPRQIALAAAAIKGAQWALFENSSHQAQFEEPEAYFAALRGFLQTTRV